MGPGACPAELDKVRTLAVPESVRSLCTTWGTPSAGSLRYETSGSAIAGCVEGDSINVSAGFGSAVYAEMA